ncbi:cytochrome P450 [Streptomyces sp. NPDC040724]|uniref:cytochrome P450 n=1 Tax=unclassified Streptomyces TaxID=2593676 RepID=UPI0033E5E7B5
MSMTVGEAGRTLADPTAYADDARLHRALAVLRREAPVHWVEAPGYNPFWAVTRHADIQEIERLGHIFLNAPRPLLVTAKLDAVNRQSEERQVGLRPLVHLDDPQHRLMRAVTADSFRPQSISAFAPRVRELARSSVDRMRGHDGAYDFVSRVSDVYTLEVLLSLLGLADEEYEQIFRFTPAARRRMPLDDRHASIREFYAYFTALAEERRASPTEDLSSVIANARVEGRPLDGRETLSQYIIVLAAGHDTASASIAGGLRALIEHPEQLEILRESPEHLPSAADEIIRWTTPVKAFMRTARADHRLRDVVIRKGQSVLLSYPSANRDEAVFDRPDTFDVRRTPNRHLAFGHGVHHCLGSALAKLEVEAFFSELIPRLRTAEPAGEPEQLKSTFSGGLKYLPVRCSVR